MRSILYDLYLIFLSHKITCGLRTDQPVMGWNTWNHFGCDITESLIIEVADAMVSTGLQQLGYNYINLDDCWQASSRDQFGRLQSNSTRFPNGLKYLGDYIHSLGLKFGIYSSAGFKTCQALPASLGMEDVDVNTFLSWGVDYLKYDNCFRDNGAPERRFPPVAESILNHGDRIVYSLCEWGVNNPATWAWKIGNSWRTSPDIKDSWKSIMINTEITAPLWRYAGPGQWNDPDMLEVGNGRCSLEEYKSHFSLWSMLKAPLIIGNDLRKIQVNDSVMSILGNKEVIDVNQDPLGQQGRRIWSDQSAEHSPGCILIATKCATGVAGRHEDSPVDQQWIFLPKGHIQSVSTGTCLTETNHRIDFWDIPLGEHAVIGIQNCDQADKWIRDPAEGTIINQRSGRCLEVAQDKQLALVQGKRIQTGKCMTYSIPSAGITLGKDYMEHQIWGIPNGTLLNLYQRQCLTVDRDAPPGKSLEIWSTNLKNNAVAVLVLNKRNEKKTVMFNLSTLGLGIFTNSRMWNTSSRASALVVRDLWRHRTTYYSEVEKDLVISEELEAHGVSMMKIWME